MKINFHSNYTIIFFLFLCVQSTFGLNIVLKSDTNKISSNSPLGKESNRNVSLNASSNSGPRDINTGIPSNVGGISIMENGLPVVYYPWPESPVKSWRQDASIEKANVLKMGEVAIITGVVGYAVDSYTRTPGDQFQVYGSLGSNMFGLLRGSLNLSGPLKNGWYYNVNASGNFDPATYDLGFVNYSDKTQIYRAGLTKKFRAGEITLQYKYASSWAIGNNAPFIYKEGGHSQELDNFRIGRDSYVLIDGKFRSVSMLYGDTADVSMKNNGFNYAHTVDLLGNYTFDNDMKLSYILRYHHAQNSGIYINPLSVFTPGTSDRYTYYDTGQPYNGMVQMVENSYITPLPINSFTSRIELTGNTTKHSWRLGLNEWFYKENKYISNTTKYNQEVAPQPRKLAHATLSGNTWSMVTDPYGFFEYNYSGEYHNGFENKLAIYGTDNFDITDRLSVNAGLRLEYHKLKGDYLPYDRPVPLGTPVTTFNNDWFLTRFTVGGVYKLSKPFGFFGEATYNERVGALEDYSGSAEPALKRRVTPMGQVGVYYNNPYVSIVSAFTYIKSNNFQSRLVLVNPENPNDSQIATVYYNIKTMGWTTDIMATPFKGFNLHFLATLQNPIYGNYAVSAYGQDYDYNGKNVTGISKILLEIEPSYTFWKDKMRVWFSARYFSKQFANLTNVLYFAPHWETFGGVSYSINKKFNLGVNITNILGQRGASGSINGSELVTDPTPFYDTVVTGSYIIPFTVGFNLDFVF